MATQSMAAALAASLPAPVAPQAESQPQVTKVPQRLEGVVDPEALRDVIRVHLTGVESNRPWTMPGTHSSCANP
jgi:hypothetical protein